MLWDIFCRVIDNYGDLGECWRLSADLAERGQKVRLWVDQPELLRWMAPQRPWGLKVLPWEGAAVGVIPADVVVETFGCELDPRYVQAITQRQPAPHWINLEYLTAEDTAARNHQLVSPHISGLTKHFFYPGFSSATGGLLREPDLLARRQHFSAATWLAEQGLATGRSDTRYISLFCYEPPALTPWLQQLARSAGHTHLLVTHGRAQAAVQHSLQTLALPLQGHGNLQVSYLPALSQTEFDHLLWSCDVNFVRGEDSLVRAIWSGQPWVWQIYPQSDGVHLDKLQALLDTVLEGIPAEVQTAVHQWHQLWNADRPAKTLPELPAWHAFTRALQTRLSQQPDLTSQLLEFQANIPICRG